MKVSSALEGLRWGNWSIYNRYKAVILLINTILNKLLLGVIKPSYIILFDHFQCYHKPVQARGIDRFLASEAIYYTIASLDK